jgi:hypothetical protein
LEKVFAFFCTAWRVVCDKDLTCSRLKIQFNKKPLLMQDVCQLKMLPVKKRKPAVKQNTAGFAGGVG